MKRNFDDFDVDDFDFEDLYDEFLEADLFGVDDSGVPYPGTEQVIDYGQLLTCLPGIIGFYPTSHLIAIGVDDVPIEMAPQCEVCGTPGGCGTGVSPEDLIEFGPVLVRDLRGIADPFDSSVYEGSCSAIELAERCRSAGVPRVLLAVISPQWPEMGARVLTARRHWLREFHEALHEVGISVEYLLGAEEIYPGEPVTDAYGNCLGIIDDPLHSPQAQELLSIGEKIVPTEYHFRKRVLYDEDLVRPIAQALSSIENSAREKLAKHGPLTLSRHKLVIRRYFDGFFAIVQALYDGTRDLDDVMEEPTCLETIYYTSVSKTLRDMSIALINSQYRRVLCEIWERSARVFSGEARANALACFAIERLIMGARRIAEFSLEEAVLEEKKHTLSMLILMAMRRDYPIDCTATVRVAAQEVLAKVYGADWGHTFGINTAEIPNQHVDNT